MTLSFSPTIHCPWAPHQKQCWLPGVDFNHLHAGCEPTLQAVSITEGNKVHQPLMFDLRPFQNTSPPCSATQYSFCQKIQLWIVQPIELVILFSLFQIGTFYSKILLTLIFILDIIHIYLSQHACDLTQIIINLHEHNQIRNWGG